MLPVLTPTDFVAVLNQTFETAYPSVVIEGELANFRISKNRWVYFDLKDDNASIKHFGTVYQLPAPLEDGMVLRVRAVPRLHPQFGFSLTVQSIELSGQGTIKKAFELLQKKLTAEGLFDPSRKRRIPYPPTSIGLITSGESAAYADFIKVIGARWRGIEIRLADVQVQGEAAPQQIVTAIEWFNRQAHLPDVLVVIRGGGSADDLQAFSTEAVTRAVAASRIPTVVAIGHEVDTSLAELAADLRASTPSNAAELLVPDRTAVLAQVQSTQRELAQAFGGIAHSERQRLAYALQAMRDTTERVITQRLELIHAWKTVIDLLNPRAALRRGYAIVRSNGVVVRSVETVAVGQKVDVELVNGIVSVAVQAVTEG